MIHKQQPITILSHNWIETNIEYIKRQIEYKLKMKTCKKINGEASSSTLVEDLASHDKRNHKKTKLLVIWYMEKTCQWLGWWAYGMV